MLNNFIINRTFNQIYKLNTSEMLNRTRSAGEVLSVLIEDEPSLGGKAALVRFADATALETALLLTGATIVSGGAHFPTSPYNLVFFVTPAPPPDPPVTVVDAATVQLPASFASALAPPPSYAAAQAGQGGVQVAPVRGPLPAREHRPASRAAARAAPP